jgi:intein/homing endonuclease
MEAMEFCIFGDTKIATPDGFLTIKELADKGRENEFIVYAYDHKLKRVVPAKAKNAHYTRDEMTYKVTFDDDSFIIATYDHRFMKRDGSYCEVKDLKAGDSMMPFYRKSFYNNYNYNWIYVCDGKEGHHGWISEHNIIAEWYYQKLKETEVVHHIDYNGKNNNPENLKIMNTKEHQAWHARHNNEKLWQNPEYREKMRICSRRTDNKHHWNGARAGENNPAYFPLDWDKIVKAARKHKTIKKTSESLGVSIPKLQRELDRNNYKDWISFLEDHDIEKHIYSNTRSSGDKFKINHKVKSVEPHEVVPVYDLTVPGYENFATDTIFSHNCPEIGAALDIFMEESTTSNDKGKILNIYSDSKRIKTILENLFNNVLDINTNLPPWTRNTPIREDSIIPLLDGSEVTIKELSNRIKSGEEIWSYAIQDGTKSIVPSKII